MVLLTNTKDLDTQTLSYDIPVEAQIWWDWNKYLTRLDAVLFVLELLCGQMFYQISGSAKLGLCTMDVKQINFIFDRMYCVIYLFFFWTLRCFGLNKYC